LLSDAWHSAYMRMSLDELTTAAIDRCPLNAEKPVEKKTDC